MSGSQCVLHLLLLLYYVRGSSYEEISRPTDEEVKFMKRYGYLPDTRGVDGDFAFTPSSLAEAVRKMQRFASLPQTGIFDKRTKQLLKRRRCGVKDIDADNVSFTSNRQRRYIIQKGWKKKDITYRVVNSARTLKKSRVEELIGAGLSMWAPYGGLRFTHVDDGPADIEVSFGSREHGDGFPFDGQGHVVAHAFPPPMGSMHFDDDEEWSEELRGEEEATDFFAVAAHEIGHALGLSHSDVEESVMFPYYRVPIENLQYDDMQAMKALYLSDDDFPAETRSPERKTSVSSRAASRGTSVQTVAAAEDEADVPDLCYSNYDTIQVINDLIYVFEENWVWVLEERKKIKAGYPRHIHDVFHGLPSYIYYIHTIYQKRTGNVVIFHNRIYLEFNNTDNNTFRLVRRGKLSDYGLPRSLPELTTAFVSNYNNKTYLIADEKFWRYDEGRNRMEKGYPRSMSAWRFVPYPVDAAALWKGDTYFFHGPRFWRFDNSVVRAHEYYPLPTAQVWFPCPSTPDTPLYFHNEPL